MIHLPASFADAVSVAYLSDEGWEPAAENRSAVRSFEEGLLLWWGSLTGMKEVRIPVDDALANELLKCRGLVAKNWLGDAPPRTALFGGVCFGVGQAWAIVTLRQPPATWQEIPVERFGWLEVDPPIFPELDFLVDMPLDRGQPAG